MKSETLSEAQIAWILCNLHERLNDLLWDRYEKEFLDWAMDENHKERNGPDIKQSAGPSTRIRILVEPPISKGPWHRRPPYRQFKANQKILPTPRWISKPVSISKQTQKHTTSAWVHS
jgi:hypothetical protein